MTLTRLMPALIVGFSLVFAANPALAQDDWVVKTSPHSVSDTVDKLTAAIEGAGAKVAAVVDHAAAAQGADLELAPTTVVIFGNPKLGTPLMVANRKVAIDLPIKVLIWQEGDATMVGYLEPDALAARYGIDAGSKPITMMKGALGKLTDAATAQ